jgi:hypothetical protein
MRVYGVQSVVADGMVARVQKPANFYVLLVPVCLQGVPLVTNGFSGRGVNAES